MVVGSNPTSELSFDFQKRFCSGLKILGLHTSESTHQWPRSDFPQVSLLAEDWAVDVVGVDFIVNLRATILGANATTRVVVIV